MPQEQNGILVCASQRYDALSNYMYFQARHNRRGSKQANKISSLLPTRQVSLNLSKSGLPHGLKPFYSGASGVPKILGPVPVPKEYEKDQNGILWPAHSSRSILCARISWVIHSLTRQINSMQGSKIPQVRIKRDPSAYISWVIYSPVKPLLPLHYTRRMQFPRKICHHHLICMKTSPVQMIHCIVAVFVQGSNIRHILRVCSHKPRL